MQALDADRRERGLELGRPGGAERRHVAQPVRTDRREVDRRRQREQRLVRADVAGRLVTPDVLLARAQGHDEGALAVEVRGHADEPPGDLADERIGRGEDAEVRPAVLRRDAERLALAGGDVRPVGAGRREDGERHRLDDRDEEGPGRVGQLADPRHRLEEPEEVGVRGDDTGHRAVGVGQHRLERRRGRSSRPRHPRRRAGSRRAPARRRSRSAGSHGSADGRRGSRAPARDGSPGRSSARPRRSPRPRRSGRRTRRRGRRARPAATRTRRSTGACPG